MSSGDNIKVAIKVRPLIPREREQKLAVQWKIQGDTIECTNALCTGGKFSFDQICDENTSTQDLFDKVTKPIVESSVNGFNGTIFAYGQTSSGKTHTMLGTTDQPGITILAVRDIFNTMSKNSNRSYLLRVSYIEIYNERVYDLLDKRNELKIQETGSGDTTVNSVEKIVNSEQSIVALISQGNKERKVAETKMNVQSSRSHAIFSIIIESQDRNGAEDCDAAVQISVLNLVDLAGSERADATGASGSRFKEGAHINKSLLSLSMVINKLAEDPDQQHINYRDSKLTRILQPSLGGNALTVIICTITPAVVDETYYTLGFANRAKRIKNKPIVNEVLSDAVMIKRMHKQITGLEKQLNGEREKCRKIEASLFQRRDQIIGGKAKFSLNRRRTWAPTVANDENGENRPPTPDKDAAPVSGFGRQIEYTEEQFNSILDSSFSAICPAQPVSLMTPLGRSIPSRAVKSLLKTPKAIFRRTSVPNLLEAGSPVNTYDRDLYIRSLEAELQEFREFQKLESDEIETLQQEARQLAEFKIQSENKEAEIKSLQASLCEMKSLLESEIAKCKAMEVKMKENCDYRLTAEQNMKKIQKEMCEATKGKTLAECELDSVRFEYEQNRGKWKTRESELLQQIDENGFEDQVKLLKDQIAELSNGRKQLEVGAWESENKLKECIAELSVKNEEIDRLTQDNAILKSQITDCQKDTSAVTNLEKLRVEYDDLSNQLMERIHETEDAAKKHAAIVTDLGKSIDELTTKLVSEKSRVEMLQSELQHNKEQSETANRETEIQKERLEREIESIKLSLSEKENQVKQCQLDMEAERSSFDERMNDAVADVNANLTSERARSKRLDEDIEALKLNVSELKIELENNKQLKSPGMDAETNAAINVMCIMLQHMLNECERITTELMVTNQRFGELKSEYAAVVNREKASSELHANSVTEHAIIVAGYESAHDQVKQDHAEVISSLERELAEMNKQLIRGSQQSQSIHTQTELCRCEELERQKGMMEDLCNKSRITIQFAVNELAILRGSYAELEMSVARQELDNLKLQKTIIENDDDFVVESSSVFASTMASTTSIANDTLMADCSVVPRDEETQASTTLTATEAESCKACELRQCDWRQLNECFSDTATIDDIETLMTKVKQLREKANEYDRLLEILLRANSPFSQCENIENAIIESQQKHLETSEQLLIMSNNYETSLAKLNIVQEERDEFQRENDALKFSLTENESKLASITTDIDHQIKENAKLRDQILDEQENVSKLHKQIETLGAEVNRLNEENRHMSDEIMDKVTEIDRLGRIVSEKMSIHAKAEKLCRVIEDIKTQLSVKECEVMALNAEKAAVVAQLEEKASQILRLETDRSKFVAASDNVHTLNSELKEVKRQKVELEKKKVQAENEVDALRGRLDKATDAVTVAVEEKNELRAYLVEIEQKMNASEASNSAKVNGMLETIDSLTQQKQTLESELAESTAKSKSDDEKLRLMAEEHSNQLKLDQENHKTIDKLKSKLTVCENQQGVLERENGSLTNTIDTQQKHIVALQSKLDGLKNDLSAIKVELAAKCAECQFLENGGEETVQLRATLETMKKKVQSVNDKKSEVEYKNSELMAAIKKQRTDIDQMTKSLIEKENQWKLKAEKEVQSVQQELDKKSTEYGVLVEKLAQMESALQQTRSPSTKLKRLSDDKSNKRADVDVDYLLRENHNLKTSHQRLEDELEEFRVMKQQTRKSKRHSTHDDTRRISGFNSNLIDMHVQTDPVNELCRCTEFDAEIVELRRKLLIKDAQFNTFKKNTGVDTLKRENEELQSQLTTIRTEYNQHRAEYDRLLDKYEKTKRKLHEFLASEADKPIFSDAQTQTNDEAANGDETVSVGSYVSQVNAYKVNEKYQSIKQVYLHLREAYKKLQREHEQAEDNIDQLQAKYEQMKIVCTSRGNEMERLTKEASETANLMEQMKTELETLKEKYARAKQVLEHRYNQILNLKKMQQAGDENVPINGNCSKASVDTTTQRND